MTAKGKKNRYAGVPSSSSGRKARYQPTDPDKALVNALSIMRVPHKRIAAMIGISDKTLERAYPRELDTAALKADAMVVANLFRQASKDDFRSIPAAVRWVQMRLGWGAHSGGNGGGLKPGEQQVMKLLIVNDPEEGLDEFRSADDGTIEVSGHEPTSKFVDPFEGKE